MNVTRFKRAIEIIEETPDAQVKLTFWQQSYDKGCGYIRSKEEATCGTIACAGGWLALHPDMQEQGLVSGFGGQPEFHSGGSKLALSFRALELFFDILDIQADFLFRSREDYEESGEMTGLTDKQVWLHRAQRLLVWHEDKL